MKILFISATYIPSINGVSYHIKHLKRQLENNGHKVHVLAPKFPGYEDTEKNVIRYFSMPNPFTTNYPIGIPLYPLSELKKINPDIVHTHHPLIVGSYSSYVAEKLNKPLYFTAHTQYHRYLNYYFPHGYQLTSRLITRDLMKLAAKCKSVISPSEETLKRLTSMGIKNSILLTNGIDTERFYEKKLNRNTRLTLIFTGRIDREKNPLFLISLSRELKKILHNFKFLVVGDGLLLNRMSSLVYKYRLEENVFLTGSVNQDLLPSILNSADIFFTPSTSEVMPLTLLEAEACGLPIVALEGSGLESVVRKNKSGLILKANPKIVAQEIVKLYKNKTLLINFSKESRKIAEKNSLDSYAKKLIDIYKTEY